MRQQCSLYWVYIWNIISRFIKEKTTIFLLIFIVSNFVTVISSKILSMKTKRRIVLQSIVIKRSYWLIQHFEFNTFLVLFSIFRYFTPVSSEQKISTLQTTFSIFTLCRDDILFALVCSVAMNNFKIIYIIFWF